MKGLYITTRDLKLTKAKEFGVYRKIDSQIEELRKHFEVDVLSGDWRSNLFRKGLARLPLFPISFGFSKKNISNGYDFAYIRLDYCDRQMIAFFKEFKKCNPRAKVVIEFATYPFEWKKYGITVRLLKYKTEVNCKKLFRYADRAITYGSLKEAYGIPTIATENGIDVDQIVPRNYHIPEDQTVDVICVSRIDRIRRIDRFLQGLSDYYCHIPTRTVRLHIVGDGPELNNLKDYVCEQKLEEYVCFYGYQTGQALDEIFDRCAIGLDALPEHYKETSSLKSREYLSKGLPIISSCTYPKEFSEIEDYVLYIRTDKSAVVIDDVVSFFDGLYHTGKSPEDVANYLRDFANRHYAMKETFRPIIDYVLGAY